MPTTEDIMRQLKLGRNRGQDAKGKDVEPEHQDDLEDKEEKSEKQTKTKKVVEDDVETEVSTDESKDLDKPPLGQSERIVKVDRPKRKQKVKEAEEVEQVVVGSKGSKVGRVEGLNETTRNLEESTGVKHQKIERRRVREDIVDNNTTTQFLYRDIFVDGELGIEFNADHKKTSARNLSHSIVDHLTSDLISQHEGVQVKIGASYYTIDKANSVFNSSTSLVRYLLLNGLSDDNISLQIARQLFLEKNPKGEDRDFDFHSVRTDELDIYALLLATKSDPERDLVEKIEELILAVDDVEESNNLANRKIMQQVDQSYHLLNGLNIASSVLLLERLGLTEGRLPNDLSDVEGFMTQDSVVKFSDILGNDIATSMASRKRTLARDQRLRGRNSMSRRRLPRSISRQGSDDEFRR